MGRNSGGDMFLPPGISGLGCFLFKKKTIKILTVPPSRRLQKNWKVKIEKLLSKSSRLPPKRRGVAGSLLSKSLPWESFRSPPVGPKPRPKFRRSIGWRRVGVNGSTLQTGEKAMYDASTSTDCACVFSLLQKTSKGESRRLCCCVVCCVAVVWVS